jgi:hypothetical protein
MSLRLKPKYRTVQENILAPGHFVIETCAQFQQWRHPATQPHPAQGRADHSGDDFQQGAFTSAIGADNPDGFALVNREADVVQCMEIRVADTAL